MSRPWNLTRTMLGGLKAALDQATKLGAITFPSGAPIRRPVFVNPMEVRLICRKLIHDAEHHGVPVGFGLRFLEVAQ
jgi:hypothetical protein